MSDEVVDIESHYGLLHGLDPDDGQPDASVTVYVEPAPATARPERLIPPAQGR